jgi:DNA repair protein RadA/Sms
VPRIHVTKMAGMRPKATFVCAGCGYESARWLGRCPGCGEWNSLVGAEAQDARDVPAEAVPITDVGLEDSARVATGVGELDRVLGGGLVPGSLVLLGGDPGVGKSTLFLQAAAGICAAGGSVLYVSGEESARQLRLRAERLGALHGRLLVAGVTDVRTVAALVAERRPSAVVVDSIQTMRHPDLPLSPGSVAQVRECAHALLRLAKESGVPVLTIGHINKAGALAGPKVLEHAVDAVLSFEGERHHAYRLLRAEKNRFGSTQELGVFEMSDRGLVEVPNPSQWLLAERAAEAAGSVVLPSVEGSRTLLVEVQALLAGPAFGSPRRTTSGIDAARLAVLLAVLERRCALRCGGLDAYVKVAGGLRLDEPAADLAVAVALASCFRDRPVDGRTVVLGEVGLGGEARAVSRVPERLREAARLGFDRAVLPLPTRLAPAPPADIEVVPVASVGEAIAVALAPRGGRDG